MSLDELIITVVLRTYLNAAKQSKSTNKAAEMVMPAIIGGVSPWWCKPVKEGDGEEVGGSLWSIGVIVAIIGTTVGETAVLRLDAFIIIDIVAEYIVKAQWNNVLSTN